MVSVVPLFPGVHPQSAAAALEPLAEGLAPDERRVLGAFGYTRNRTLLHRDAALMPRRRAAWASWNYLADQIGRAHV